MITVIVDYDNDTVRVGHNRDNCTEIFKKASGRPIFMSDLTKLLNEFINVSLEEHSIELVTQDEGQLTSVDEW